MRVRLPRLASTQVQTKRRSSVTFLCHKSLNTQYYCPLSPCRGGHPALQPTTVPDRQQSQGPKFLQLHVLQGFRGPAERGGRPQEPRRHWPQHHGSLPARGRRAGGTHIEDLLGPKLPSRNSNHFSMVRSDFFVSLLIAGFHLFTQMVESWRTREENWLSCFVFLNREAPLLLCFEYLGISPSRGLPPYCTSALFSVHLEILFFINSLFYVHLKGHEIDPVWCVKSEYVLVYLCLIPMQYGANRRSRCWHASACLDHKWEFLQSHVTVLNKQQAEKEDCL